MNVSSVPQTAPLNHSPVILTETRLMYFANGGATIIFLIWLKLFLVFHVKWEMFG